MKRHRRFGTVQTPPPLSQSVQDGGEDGDDEGDDDDDCRQVAESVTQFREAVMGEGEDPGGHHNGVVRPRRLAMVNGHIGTGVISGKFQ